MKTDKPTCKECGCREFYTLDDAWGQYCCNCHFEVGYVFKEEEVSLET